MLWRIHEILEELDFDELRDVLRILKIWKEGKR